MKKRTANEEVVPEPEEGGAPKRRKGPCAEGTEHACGPRYAAPPPRSDLVARGSKGMLMGLPNDVVRILLGMLRSPDLRAVAATCSLGYARCQQPMEEMRERYGSLHPYHLSEEQWEAYRRVVEERRNVVVCGSAGTGKSQLLRTIVHGLQAHLGLAVQTCAPTGTAADALHGLTLHQVCGISPMAPGRFAQHGTPVLRMQLTQVLVLDEISMCDGDTLDVLSEFCRHASARAGREAGPAFGGRQVVVSGDFAQLPPVSGGRLAFQAACWGETFRPEDCLSLERAFRQSSDLRFLRLLGSMRFGRSVPNDLRTLLERRNTHVDQAEFRERFQDATCLCYSNQAVDRMNAERLERMAKPRVRFGETLLCGRNVADHDNDSLSQLPLDARVELCQGAVVVCRKNDHAAGIFNGSVGRVERFVDLMRASTRTECSGLVWMLGTNSISLGQDDDEDGAGDDMVGVPGTAELMAGTIQVRHQLRGWQEFVGLLRDADAQRSQRLIEFRAEAIFGPDESPLHHVPEVLFHNGTRALVLPVPLVQTATVPVTVNDPSRGGFRTALRRVPVRLVLRMPVRLAFALTIHSSQGMTLSRTKVDLSNTSRCPELIYTALSRVRRLDDLFLLSLPPWRWKPSASATLASEFDAALVRWPASRKQLSGPQ